MNSNRYNSNGIFYYLILHTVLYLLLRFNNYLHSYLNYLSKKKSFIKFTLSFTLIISINFLQIHKYENYYFVEVLFAQDEKYDTRLQSLENITTSSNQHNLDLHNLDNKQFYRYLTSFGKYGNKPNEFNNPKSMAFSPNKEYLAVCDTENHRIIIFKIQVSEVLQFVPQIILGGTWSRTYLDSKNNIPSIDFYSYPQGIAWIDNDTLIVSDTENHRLKKVNIKGEVLSVIGKEGWKDGYFHQPLGVAVDSDQNIYVVEPRSKYIRELGMDFGQRLRVQGNRLQVLDKSGKCIKRLGHMHRMCGRRNRQFKSPTRVCVANNYVFIADNGNHRVLVFDKNLEFYKRIENWQFYKLRYPNGINVSEDGYVAIADTGNNKIVILDPNFRIYQILEYAGSPNNKFVKPYEAHFGTNGYLYVLDTKNSCIHVFAK